MQKTKAKKKTQNNSVQRGNEVTLIIKYKVFYTLIYSLSYLSLFTFCCKWSYNCTVKKLITTKMISSLRFFWLKFCLHDLKYTHNNRL